MLRISSSITTVALIGGLVVAPFTVASAAQAAVTSPDSHCVITKIDATNDSVTCTYDHIGQYRTQPTLKLPVSATDIEIDAVGGHGFASYSGDLTPATRVQADLGTEIAGETVTIDVGGNAYYESAGYNGGGEGVGGGFGGGGRTDVSTNNRLVFVAPGSGGAGGQGRQEAATGGAGGYAGSAATAGGAYAEDGKSYPGGQPGQAGSDGTGGAGGDLSDADASGTSESGGRGSYGCGGIGGGGGGGGYGGGGGGAGSDGDDSSFACSGTGGGAAGGVLAPEGATVSSTDKSPGLVISWKQHLAITACTPPATTQTYFDYYTYQVTSDVEGTTFDLDAGSAAQYDFLIQNDGLIKGVPRTIGSFPLTVRAKDASGFVQRFCTATIVVNPVPDVAFTNDAPPPATIGQPYTFAFTASGCPGCTFSASPSNLPAGLTLATDGTVTGTPDGTQSGSVPYYVTAKASNGRSNDTYGRISVEPAITIATMSLPATAVGAAYSTQLTGSGGSSDLTWSATTPLPSGLTLTPSGLLAGTPRAPGAFTVKVQAKDDAGRVATVELPLTVAKGTADFEVTYNGRSFAVTVSGSDDAPAPTGTVRFEVDGKNRGSLPLRTDGTAVKGYTIPAGDHSFRVVYSGDANYVSLTSATTDRKDPTITATPDRAPNANGWYRAPVTYTFACTAATAPVESCPAKQTVRTQGANQRLSRTIVATDGGTANTTTQPINIDTTIPSLRLVGVSADKTYTADTLPTVTCQTSDALSGVESCPIKYSIGRSTITYAALSTDRAGNTHKQTVTAQFRGPKPATS